MLLLDTHNLNRVGPQISSLVNLTRLCIFVRGEAGKEGINILASLPMLLYLTVSLSNDKRHVRLAYKQYLFNQGILFFSYNK